MRIGQFEFKPSLTISLLFVLFAAALIALGTWQMRRAAQKITILAAAENARESQAVPVAELTDLTVAASKHTKVKISGAYDGGRQFLWDNRVYRSQAGFEVITPVRTANGLVLVNRGWVAPGATRAELPDVSIDATIAARPVTVTGLFSRPSKGLVKGEPLSRDEPWPKVLQFFDYAAIEQALGETVLAGVVQPQQRQAEFYIANWEPTAAIGPTRHYGYAFQWYAMAAALCILFIVYNTKRIKPVQ